MKPVCGEFLKEGALSVDRLIEERAPPKLKTYYSNYMFRLINVRKIYLVKIFRTDSWWRTNGS